MKGRFPAGAQVFFFAAFLVLSLPAAAEDQELSGTVESNLRAARLADEDGGDGGNSLSFEQYANLRLEARAGVKGTFHAAANLFASTDSDPVIELERLYYRIEEDAFDAEAGLFRLAFGFGQAWSPSDFMAARNPLVPDARPRGILGAAATAYPSDEWQATAFAAAGNDPMAADGEGAVAGASAEYHGRSGSLQVLYAIQADDSGAADAVHRGGLSIKADAVVGLALDALYKLDGVTVRSGDYHGLDWNAARGLMAALGADYSLLDGDLYLLAQYLYSGGGALDPREGYGPRNYVYAAANWRIDDYSSAALDCGASLDDFSAVPSLTLSHEPFQGMALSISGRLPLDERTFSSSGNRGEFGPVAAGRSFSLSAKAKLRF